MPAKKATPTEIYQLKITLADTKPPIWRRVLVPGNITLERLHSVVQNAMGWGDEHLHQFTIAGVDYGCTDPDMGVGDDLEDERRIRLNQVVRGEKAKFVYVYDFGDNWKHHMVVEKILAPEPGQRYPVCLAGARHCPPDDCGGVWGYEEFLKAIKDPKNPEHEEMLEWIGDEFDPEAFDLDEINEGLPR